MLSILLAGAPPAGLLDDFSAAQAQRYAATRSLAPTQADGWEMGLTGGEVVTFMGKEPLRSSGGSKVFVRFRLRELRYPDEASAAAALGRFLASADASTGHSYAWDYVLQKGRVLYHLAMPCLLARPAAEELEGLLRTLAETPDDRGLAVACSCGGACKGT